MGHWREERQHQHEGLQITIRVESGGRFPRRHITAEDLNSEGFYFSEFVDGVIWEGHCHGQLYMPRFLEAAAAAHARFVAQQQVNVRARQVDPAALLRQALPDEHLQSDPHARGYRDALESVALALESAAFPRAAILDVLQTALDAFANNVDEDGEGAELGPGRLTSVGRDRREAPSAA